MLLAVAVGTLGCAIKRTRRVAPAEAPAPPKVASEAELITRIDARSAAIETLTAAVDLEPSAGSIYSGVIKQYHDVKGFLLVRRPDLIRITGQAPIVRTDIFDMASDGKQFSLYVPSEGKFYTGATDLPVRQGKTLENLRPQHVLEALLLQPIDTTKETTFLEQVARQGERDYVIFVLSPSGPGRMRLKRKIWFNRAQLEISRLQLYGEGGACVEDVSYANYQDWGGVNYPSLVTIERPTEDYSLTITLLSAHFNQPVPIAKFTLKKPPAAQLIDLGAAKSHAGASDGQ